MICEDDKAVGVRARGERGTDIERDWRFTAEE